MKRIYLIGVISLLCACPHPDRRYPISPPSDSSRLTTGAGTSKPADVTVISPDMPISPQPISKAPEETPVDIVKVINGLNGQLHDAFFDYDRADVRPDAVAALQQDANLLLPMLSDFPQLRVIIEGHCDERGSAEYNLALGDQRASAVKNAIVAAGVSASRIKTISYGKEKPFCSESNEACWQQNRRGHFVYQK